MAFGPWMTAPGFSAGIETGTIPTATSRIPENHPFREAKPEFRTWRWWCHGPAGGPGPRALHPEILIFSFLGPDPRRPRPNFRFSPPGAPRPPADRLFPAPDRPAG